MRRCWDISASQWDAWVQRLRLVTFQQSKYRPKLQPRSADPIFRYQYYGVVEEDSFSVSPSMPGLNQMPVVFTGRAVPVGSGRRVTIRAQFAPYIRYTARAVFADMAICLLGALFLTWNSPQRGMLLGICACYLVVLTVWLVVTHHILSRRVRKYFPQFEHTRTS